MTYPCETCLKEIKLLPYADEDGNEGHEEVGHDKNCRDKYANNILNEHLDEL